MSTLKLLRTLESAKLCFSTSSSSYFAVKLNLEECCTPVVRTPLKNPIDHTKNHHGMWYTIDESIFPQIQLPRKFREICEIFQEACFMIREPSTTIIDYIKRSDLEKPPNRFMMYGVEGVGKTICLNHVFHFLVTNGWIVVHIFLAKVWLNQFKEIQPSLTREGFYDHTVDGSIWLKNFKLQNEILIKELGLVTDEDFVWNQRETTVAGTPLLEFIEDGITRTRYASECIYFLMRLLKNCASADKCKVAFVTDGTNAFWTPISAFRRDDRTLVEVEKFTVIQAFKQLFEKDWKNGVIVGTIDQKCSPLDRRESHFPRYLLRKEGWEALDPFVPVRVDHYTDFEYNSMMDYYVDRNWLATKHGKSETAREELKYASNKNPTALMKLVYSK